MRRRAKAESGGGHDGGGLLRWLLTYADMITLLLVFFIVLYAVSQVNKARYEVLMKALKQVLTGQQVVTQIGGTVPVPPPVIGKVPTTAQAMQEQTSLERVAREIQQAADQSGAQSEVSVTVATIGVRVSFLNGVLFDLGRADIRPQSYPLLRHIASILGSVPNQVVVEGYTDDLPINTYLYHSNWDLSAIRSTRVIEFLIQQGLDPLRFAAEAYGQYRPIASNETSAGRQMNRHVDLVILRQPPYTFQEVLETPSRVPRAAP